MRLTEIKVPRRDWRRGLAGLKRLVENPYDTPAIFEVLHSLDGATSYRMFIRMLHSLEGGRQAYQRAELAERLRDRAWLARFAPGTYGAAYRDFIEAHPFDNDGLMQLAGAAVDEVAFDLDHPVLWYARRATDVHDLWHVLTGYGADILGESCLLAFAYAQTRSLGFALIELGALLTLNVPRPWRARRAILEGYELGRRCDWLMPLDYPALMALPLEAARAAVNLRRPRVYQPVEDPRIPADRKAAA